MFDAIVRLTDEIEPELIRIRRDLHQYPEVGWEEFRTSAFVAQQLTDLGFEVLVGEDALVPEERMGVPSEERLEAAYQRALDEGADPAWLERMKGGLTGVVGILRNGEGPTIGLRFDIDALPMDENSDPDHLPNQEGFASVHPQTMHSCGHDGHTAIGLGVARVMNELRDSWSGTLKFMFQPAEEGVRGAKSMVAKGHLDDAQYMLGSHNAARGENDGPGDVFPGSGGSLATTKLDVTFHGTGAHAGENPERGDNALHAMATAIMGLYGISRTSEANTRVNVGIAQSGLGRSSIPYTAYIQAEVRGETSSANAFMEERARRVIEHSALMYNCTADISVEGAAIVLESDRPLMERIAAVLPNVGVTPTQELRTISKGSEDYSYMMERVQSNGGEATFMIILSDHPSGAHVPEYDFTENVIGNGVKAFCATIYDLAKK